MKKPGLCKGQHFVGAFTLHTLILPRVPERIRRFVNATYAANGGPEHMSLNNWIDADEKVERKLKNECSKTQR
jgi:hypothetical protein